MTHEPAVIVTGASGALGSATTSAFLRGGYAVVGVDRDPAVTDLAGEGYHGLCLDLTETGALETALAGVHRPGPLHHLVGIAGGALPEEPATQDDPRSVSPELFRRSLEVNLTSQFLALRAALEWFRAADPPPSGAERSVTLISSWNALTSQGMPAYSAAKAGLIGMMYALVRPLGAEGIRINVVAPGTIRTPRTERIWAHDEGHFDRLAVTTATGRLGVPDDVARTCVALATELTHVTGQVLAVDGGQCA